MRSSVDQALEVLAMVIGAPICRLRGHHWHDFPLHAASPVRVCDRCSLITHRTA